LFLDGASLGEQARQPLSHIEWKVPYAPGKLVAEGKRGGKVVCESIVQTAGAPGALRAEADRVERLLRAVAAPGDRRGDALAKALRAADRAP
jgi:hypothetical protein